MMWREAETTGDALAREGGRLEPAANPPTANTPVPGMARGCSLVRVVDTHRSTTRASEQHEEEHRDR